MTGPKDDNTFEIDGTELAKRMVERLSRFPHSVDRLKNNTPMKTARQLLGAMLEVEVKAKQGELMYLKAMKLLAKAAVEEKHEAASPRVPLSDVKMDVGDEGVALWYYIGGGTDWYPTKMCAEIAARAQFPDETEEARYARLVYKRFVQEV